MPITGIATGVHYTWNILAVVLNRTGTFMAMENFGVRADIVGMYGKGFRRRSSSGCNPFQ